MAGSLLLANIAFNNVTSKALRLLNLISCFASRIYALIIVFFSMYTYRYTAEEIEVKVSTFRKMLMDKEGVTQSSAIERDQFGRPM